MTEREIRYIQLPANEKYPSGHQLALKDRVLVVIGANGSGKTRFGAWLDERNFQSHHRVSAHRSLSFPEAVQPTDLKEAERFLSIGHAQKDRPEIYRLHGRWQNNPVTALLNDFAPLVTVLVSEGFSVSDQYRVMMQSENKYKIPPRTRLDLVKEVWESVLPSRELIISGCQFEVRNRQDNAIYHAKEMSDGERGIFYLIAEALSVPRNGVFIVDEPELHLHRAIQSRLWDAIELARPDCTFVYITHDIGFAASRKDATKIWLREYSQGKSSWEEVPETDEMPEAMLLEVIGSRKPILFVEGTRSSLDYFIYGLLFPDYCIAPCGSCENVIHATKTFMKMAELHHNTCCGLIDQDGRSEADVTKLEEMGVKVLPVALIENLLLTEPVLLLAAKKLAYLHPNDTFSQAQSRVFDQLRKNSVQVISNLTRQEVETKLRRFGKGGDGAEALTAAFTETCATIKPDEIYKRWEIEIERVLLEKDYKGALRYYKTKGLAAEASAIFKLQYQEQVMRWLRSNDASEFVEAIREGVPKIGSSTSPGA